MDVIGLAAEALKPISDEGTIVQQGWYDESLKRLHVTLWKLRDTEDAHSDDECEIEAASIQVNIWSRSDQQTLVKRIKRLMKKKSTPIKFKCCLDKKKTYFNNPTVLIY